jgi:hypothetical protein
MNILFMINGCKAAEAFAPRAENGDQAELYVPKDLDDCFAQLKKMLPAEEIAKIRDGGEKDMIDYHFGLGMWMRNNWGLWKGSRLAKWFNSHGIYHADDMSSIILDSFWRHLNGKQIRLEDQIKRYQEFWKKQKRAPKENPPPR